MEKERGQEENIVDELMEDPIMREGVENSAVLRNLMDRLRQHFKEHEYELPLDGDHADDSS